MIRTAAGQLAFNCVRAWAGGQAHALGGGGGGGGGVREHDGRRTRGSDCEHLKQNSVRDFFGRLELPLHP